MDWERGAAKAQYYQPQSDCVSWQFSADSHLLISASHRKSRHSSVTNANSNTYMCIIEYNMYQLTFAMIYYRSAFYRDYNIYHFGVPNMSGAREFG